jgi:GrpB-like predicted nucleotidyltransferase (UPF0157 family)
MLFNAMSTEELGKLFPVLLTEYNPYWVKLFELEKVEITKAIGFPNIIQIDHIGSTAIPGIMAKPTIDILLQITSNANVKAIIDNLKNIGYFSNLHPKNPPPHLTMVKGYSEKGFDGQAYHIHLRYRGDWDELVFRDYLINHPETAEEYVKLKLQLATKFKNNREEYTEGKTEFVKRIVVSARKDF